MLETWNAKQVSAWRQEKPLILTREAGLNEIGFYYYGLSDSKAPSDTFCRFAISLPDVAFVHLQAKIVNVWSQLRLLHPLLDTQFRFNDAGRLVLDYCWQEREARAKQSIQWHDLVDWNKTRDEITNCPRIINDRHLSQLRIYHNPNERSAAQVEIVLLSSHAISDGIRIFSIMNDLLHLLAQESTSELRGVKIEPSLHFVQSRLPRAMEGQMPIRKRTPKSLWREAILHVLHANRSNRAVGAPHPTFQACTQPVRTTQMIHELTPSQTRALREVSRQNGCTIGHLIYAASTAAFTRLTGAPRGSTAFIGTPADARRLFRPELRKNTDEFVLALAFLSVFLPCIEIEHRGKTKRNQQRLWTLARLAKNSVHGSLADPAFPIYSFIEQEQRAARHTSPPTAVGETKSPARQLTFGSSAIGDLNVIMQTDSLPFALNDLSVGMRARQGEALMHSYTFKRKLRLSLIYDAQLGPDRMRQWLQETANLMLMVLPDDMDVQEHARL